MFHDADYFVIKVTNIVVKDVAQGKSIMDIKASIRHAQMRLDSKYIRQKSWTKCQGYLGKNKNVINIDI